MPPPDKVPPGFLNRVRMGLSNLLRPKAYQGAFESTRYSVHRTRIDAPQPTDFRMEMTGATRREMVRLSRWLEKNNGLYKQMIKDTAIYSVGDGIGLQCLGGDFDWQNLVEAEWEQECIRPEMSGRFSMTECLYIICEALDRDGEIFAIKTKDKRGNPKFQIIESHRVETPPDAMSLPDIFDGIRFDRYGKPTFYYVKQGDGKYEPIRAASMMHIFDPEYASQSRAFPPHQHAINHMRDEMDLLAMEKTAVKDNSRTSRILKVEDTRMDSGDLGLGQPLGEGNSTSNTDPDALNRVLGGVTAVLSNNESLVSYQSARPSAAFTGFIDHLRRDSVMGGLPYEFVADPTRAGGASVRLVVAKAGRFFSHRQSIIINRFLQDYFQFWCGLRIDKVKDIPNARNWWKTEWVCCKSVTVDAGREGANERADLDMGRIPPSDDFQSRGLGFEKTIRKMARDHAFIQRVSKETGVPEDKLWRKTPTGGGGQQQPPPNVIPEGALGVVMPGPDGQPQIVPIDQIVGQKPEEMVGDALANTEPELAPPPKTPAAEPASQMETSVDTLPKQNPGLSRNREQPFQR
jgi:capsid protein